VREGGRRRVAGKDSQRKLDALRARSEIRDAERGRLVVVFVVAVVVVVVAVVVELQRRADNTTSRRWTS